MKFKELMDNFEDWNITLVVNDNNLNRIANDIAWKVIENNPSFHNREVVIFGFYDGEMTVRLGEETEISYERLTEIATYLKDTLKDYGYSGDEIVDYLNENFDTNLNLNEIDFIGFYNEEEEKYCCILQDALEGRR